MKQVAVILICSSPVTRGVDQLFMWKEEDTEGRGVLCGQRSKVDLNFVWWCEWTDPQGARPLSSGAGQCFWQSVVWLPWSLGQAGGTRCGCFTASPGSLVLLPSVSAVSQPRCLPAAGSRGPVTSLRTTWSYRPGS